MQLVAKNLSSFSYTTSRKKFLEQKLDKTSFSTNIQEVLFLVLKKGNRTNPIVSSIEGPNLKLPSIPFASESELPLKVSFNGCRHQQKQMEEWVETMESVHHSVWKAAGIYEAIMGSVYRVHTYKNLIFGLVEKGDAVRLNTFVFPWGEAIVTLEDMMIWEGSLFCSPQSPELVEIEENLEKIRRLNLVCASYLCAHKPV